LIHLRRSLPAGVRRPDCRTPNAAGAALFLGVLAVLPACARNAPAEDAALAIPEQWSVASDGRSETPWWESLRDPELDALIQSALEQNLDVRAAAARLEQADQLVRESRSRQWPTLDASLGYSRARVNAGPPVGTITQGTWSAGLAASYEIDAFGRYRNNVAAARADALASLADIEALRLSVAAEIVDAWVEQRYQRARRAILEQQLAIADSLTDLSAARFAYGLATASELLTQTQQEESFRALLPQTVAAEQVAANRVAVLLGEAPSSRPLSDTAALPTIPAIPPTGLPADLVLARPDVRAAQLRADAADRRVAAAVADRLPTLRLTGNIGLQSQNLADIFDDFVWNAALSVVQPIFDAGRRRAVVARAEATYDERVLAFRRALLVALREVEDALARRAAQESTLAAVEADLLLARESLEVTRNQFVMGAVDLARVTAAEATVARTELAKLDAQRSMFTHYISIGRALGAPWNQTVTDERR
jgi:multidrug efflux system outer membrane protein